MIEKNNAQINIVHNPFLPELIIILLGQITRIMRYYVVLIDSNTFTGKLNRSIIDTAIKSKFSQAIF